MTTKQKKRTDEQLSTQSPASQPIHIPTIEEIAQSKHSYGLFYCRKNAFYYYDLENELNHKIEDEREAQQIVAFDEDIYYSHEETIRSLFGNFKRERVNDENVNLHKLQGRLCHSIRNMLYDTLSNEPLTVEGRLEQIYQINAIVECKEELFWIVNKRFENALIEVHQYNGKYFPGQRVIFYGETVSSRCQTEVIPGGFMGENGRRYDFSIFSQVRGYCFDIDGEIIGDSPRSRSESFTALGLQNNILEIAVSAGYGINKLSIDIKDKNILDSTSLFDFSFGKISLTAIKDHALHQKLIDHARRK